MKKVWFVSLLFLVIASVAHAGRVLPPNAQIGKLTGAEYPYVKIGDTTYRLAPGARVLNPENRVIFPAQYPTSGAVFYQFDLYGQILTIWLMTPEEEAASTGK